MPEIREMIRQMSTANPLWGAPLIHGELLKLGIEISQGAVSKYMAKPKQPPSQSWRTFLTIHARDIVSIDFFTVPTVTFGVIYVFLVLDNARRTIRHFNVICSPSATWTGQQIVEAYFDFEEPRYLIRDRGGKFGGEFIRRVAAPVNRADLDRLQVTLAEPICQAGDRAGVSRPCDHHKWAASPKGAS